MAFLGSVCFGTNTLVGYCNAHNADVPGSLRAQFFGFNTAFLFAQGINILGKRGTLGRETALFTLIGASIAVWGLSAMGQAAGKIAAFALVIPPHVVLSKRADHASRLS